MRINIVKRTSSPLRRIEPNQGAQLLTLAQLAARRDADALVEAASCEAERILSTARVEARRLADAARSDADRQGSRRWTDAAFELAREREQAVASLEREALALALEIARRIVGDVVADSNEAWVEIVARSTDRLRRDALLIIRHSPGDSERVDAVRNRLSGFREVVFESDEALDVGDCVAECAGVRVDARLSVQLAALERRLGGAPISEDRL